MLDNRTVGRTIAALRQANGMTQQKLAAAMNVSHQAVSKWENGAALPDMQTMLDLSKLFGVTMEQLLTGEVPEERLRRWDEGRAEPPEPPKAPNFDLRNVAHDIAESIGGLFRPVAANENDGAEDAQPVTGEWEEELAQASEEQERAMEDAVRSSEEQEQAAEQAEEPADRAAERAERNAERAARRAQRNAEAEEDAQSASANFNGEPIDIDRLVQMAPFMSRDALSKILIEYRGKLSPRAISRLAPFVSAEGLEALIWRVDGDLDWDLLRRLAPFLRKEMVDRLTLAVAKGEMAIRPVADNIAQTAEEIGKRVHKAVAHIDFPQMGDKLSREAGKIGEKIARELNNAFGGERQDQGGSETSERVRSAKRRMYERAIQDGKWDWIGERIDDIDDELKDFITHRAEELGKADWLSEVLDDYVSPDAARVAIAEGNWDWIGEHIDDLQPMHEEILRMTAEKGQWDFIEEYCGEMNIDDAAEIAYMAMRARQEDALAALAENHLSEQEIEEVACAAIHEGKESLLESLAEHMGADCVRRICLMLVDLEKWDAYEEMIEYADEGECDLVCIRLAEAGRWDSVENLLDNASQDAIAHMLEIAAAAGNWDAISMIEEYLS